MRVLLLLAAIALCLAVVALVILKKRGQFPALDRPWPFYAKRVLTTPEQVLFYRLVKALPDNIVLAQVQVSRVLGVKRGYKFNEWNNRINRLSYDFIVCSKDASVVAAIELDDKTHEDADRAETDKKKDKATAAAGIRMIRWQAKSLPNEVDIQAVFGQFHRARVPTGTRPTEGPEALRSL